MALVDTMTIRAAAGRGGDGVVRWLHLKGKEKGGPAGGDGGRGGDVIFKAVRDLGVLARYKGRGEFKAEPGESGGSQNMHGADGASITIEVPVGVSITRLGTGEVFELLEDGDELIALRGGSGGYGNTRFKSSTNQNPFESRAGEAGEEDAFRIELKMIADAGLVGLPNAGKSSLLNALTAARARVGDYPFTTLEPNLGVLYGFVVADIPGLIEGAAEGKGLGHEFLRHIERTKLIIHCVSFDIPDPLSAYRTVRRELAEHAEALAKKPEILFLTKSDTVSPEDRARILGMFKSEGLEPRTVSVIDDTELKAAGEALVQFLSKAV